MKDIMDYSIYVLTLSCQFQLYHALQSMLNFLIIQFDGYLKSISLCYFILNKATITKTNKTTTKWIIRFLLPLTRLCSLIKDSNHDV